MLKGDQVVVRIDGKQVKGKVAEVNGNHVVVEFNHINKRIAFDKESFPKSEVIRFVHLDKQDARITHTKQFPDLYALICSLQNKFFPHKKIEVHNELTIAIDNVSISPCIMEVSAIGRINEHAGWTVELAHTGYSSDGFADVDVANMGDYRHYSAAANSFIKLLFEQEVNDFLEKSATQEYAKNFIDELL